MAKKYEDFLASKAIRAQERQEDLFISDLVAAE